VSALFEAVADFYRTPGEDSRPPYKFRALSQTPTNSALATSREVLRANAQSDLVSDQRSLAARWRGAQRVAGLRAQAALERLAGATAYSPSAIEAYLRCPYAWFHSNTIRAQTLETEFDAREQGSLAHEILARAYASMLSAGVPRVTERSLDLALEAVQFAWDGIVSELGEAQNVLELSERRATLAWATRIVEDDAMFAEGFCPRHMEWGFGPGSEHSVDLGGFSLRGRIDRVDVDATGRAIVIDYKRATGPTAAEIIGKRRIQVPLYMEAVRLGLGLEPVAGVYRGLRKRSDRGLLLADAGITGAFTRTDVKDETEFRSIVEEALALARDAVARMREGRIEQAPHDPASCRTCSALSVCGGSR
jgi:ATP-dependent helicase/nuclease subunit B